MNEKELDLQDQADDLRTIFKEIEEADEQKNKEEEEHQEMDILNLPPRSEVHNKKGRSKLKLSKPFLRFILVLLLLILVIFGVYLYAGEEYFFF